MRAFLTVGLFSVVLACGTSSDGVEEAGDTASIGEPAALEEVPDSAVHFSYDRFDNWTTAETPRIAGEFVSLGASYFCTGSPGCRTDTVFVAMNLNRELVPQEEYTSAFPVCPETGDLAQSPDDCEGPVVYYGSLIFLLDGEHRIRRGRVTENYRARIDMPLSDLLEMVKADSVEFRMLDVEGHLTKEQQKLLARVLSSMDVSE